MKKILFVANQAHDLFFKDRDQNLVFGGAEVQMYFWAKELSKNNYGISVLTSGYSKERKKEVDGVTVINYKKRSPASFKISTAYKLTKSLFREKPDYVFVRLKDMSLIPVFIYSLIFRKNFFFMMAHDGVLEKKRFLDNFFYYFLKKSSHVFAQNKTQLNLYKEKVGGNNVSILKNSFPVKSLDSGLEKDGVLWVGRSESWKGVEEMIEIIESLPDKKFTIVLTKAKDLNYFNQCKEKFSGYENVNLMEYVDFKNSQDLYNRAKMFINTSEKEGFPNSFLQAGVGKTPVISLRVNPNNFVSDHGCYCEGDIGKAISFIKTLDSDKNFWDRKSLGIHEYVSKEHSMRSNVDSVKRVLV